LRNLKGTEKKTLAKDVFPGEIPYHRFKEFIALNADRFTILKTLLGEIHLSYKVVDIGKSRHFFVYPERCFSIDPALAMIGCPTEMTMQKALANGRISTILAAHYDRAAESPGANDNSAAVFELIKTALTLKKKDVKNWLIIFTDKEELTSGDSIRDQGSYALAKWLKTTYLEKSQIFIFDCCGVGDTLIISTAVDHLLRNDDESPGTIRSKHLVGQMRERALTAARLIRLEKVLLMPTPFSDDAGFFRAGLTAQTITVLPSNEATDIAFLLRTKPDFADALVSKDVLDTLESDFLPPTWLSLNGPDDQYEKLTPRYFQNIVDFAYALAGGKE
jgi:hypothetical protein